MMEEKRTASETPEIISLVDQAGRFCDLVENAGSTGRTELVSQLHLILSGLYALAAAIEPGESQLEEVLENVVTEPDWQRIEQAILSILGPHNEYLEVFDPRMAESEGPVTCSLAEDMADIYQDLKNFVIQYHAGTPEIMHEALVNCLENFREYWGRNAANALRALHALKYHTPGLEEEDLAQPDPGAERDTSGWILSRIQEQYRREHPPEE